MNCYQSEEKSELQSQIQTSTELITNFFDSSASQVVTGKLDKPNSEITSVCTRSQSQRSSTPAPENTLETSIREPTFKPKKVSQPDFQIPNTKKPSMNKKNTKSKIDYNKMSSDTPPSPSRSSSSGSINKEPMEQPSVANSLKQVEKMSDKEMIEHLTKNVPELKEEALYLLSCPEKIGLEPLRDILLYKVKNWKQSTMVIKALVTGIRAGLSYSLREQHKTYIEMFNDMKNVMSESSKMMTVVSQSLHETLRSENKESGKALSSLKEVLSTAHELTKTLVEGKTHGHLQVPTKPSRSKTPEKRTRTPPPQKTENKEEAKDTKSQIKEALSSMDKDNFYGVVDCSGENLMIKTKLCGILYRMTYNEKILRWDIRKEHRRDEQPTELSPYIKIFTEVTRTKSVAKKPLFFAMGWFLYSTSQEISADLDADEFWRKFYKTILPKVLSFNTGKTYQTKKRW